MAAVSTEPRIEHLVVLMLENRSFDHMLGFLPHPGPHFLGLLDEEHHNVAASGEVVYATNTGAPGEAAPDHSNCGVLEQLKGYGDVPENGGFVINYASASGDPAAGKNVMHCLDPLVRCPVLAQLALDFAVCDHWFSSVPGETWPNRNFAHAGTSGGTADIEFGFYDDRTIFELLASKGASWRIYRDGVAQAWCFRNLWRQRDGWLDRRLGRKTLIHNWREQREFYQDVASSDLPSYTFIEPAHRSLPGESRETNSQHPDCNQSSDADFYAGEQLVRNIYQSLVDNPSLFERTLLLITYDEHGGFYDHVAPPAATPPGRPLRRTLSRTITRFLRTLHARLTGKPVPKTCRFGFDRLGARVPAVLISPWIKPHTVLRTQLEHASIPATLRALFDLGPAGLTARDTAANTFYHVVQSGLTTPRDLRGSRSTDRGLPPPRRPAPPALDTATTIDSMTPPPDRPRTESKADRQLEDLAARVHKVLHREHPDAAPPAQTHADGGTGAAEVHAAASVNDEFSAAARAVRERRTADPDR